MRRLTDFLKLRKQNDRVKLALLFFLLAGYFGVTSGMQVAEYASAVGEPVEYVLQSPSTGAVLDMGMQKIREMDGVLGVSRQTEITLSTEDKSLVATVLDRQYLSNCYGLNSTGAGHQFWLSKAAFDSFLGNTASPARLAYQIEDSRESGNFTLADSFPAEESYAVTAGSTVDLGGSSTLRVMLEKTDLSGADVRRLESLGFSVMNREFLLEQSYETELMMTRLRYGLIATILSVTAGIAFLLAAKER